MKRSTNYEATNLTYCAASKTMEGRLECDVIE
jgi:hypothetical protein